MRLRATVPARQLASVALRYQRKKAPNERDDRVSSLPSSSRHRTVGLSRAEYETPDLRRKRLEAVLFLTREPLNSRKLAALADLADGTEARSLIKQLNRQYDQSATAFRIEEVAGGYQMLTRPQFATWLRRLDHVPSETRLSAPAMETLAVVAYRQPVLRAEIEAVRGVSCGEILRQLMERDLMRISGRSHELGRPYLYSTTKRFLRVFGLRGTEELPRAESLRQTPLADVAATTDDSPNNVASSGGESDHSQMEEC